MGRVALKIVFDTNIFTPGSFPLLDKSAMRARCKEGRVDPIYGHVFLEETFRAYAQEDKREQLVRQWLPFVAETTRRLPDDFPGIWHRELVQGRGLNASVCMPLWKQQKLFAGFARIPLDGSWRAWQRAQPALEEEAIKRAAQRGVSKDIRAEFAAWRKLVNFNPRKHGTSRFGAYASGQIDFAGKEYLPAVVACHRPYAVADRWAKTKWRYPFFTTYVANMLYMAHHAMMRPNDPIDLNAQADLNLMTHLLWADVLVSNEEGFLKTAFEEIWRPQGKMLWTTKKLCSFLE